jgi:hypothetical protein
MEIQHLGDELNSRTDIVRWKYNTSADNYGMAHDESPGYAEGPMAGVV